MFRGSAREKNSPRGKHRSNSFDQPHRSFSFTENRTMRTLASISTYLLRKRTGKPQVRRFSSFYKKVPSSKHAPSYHAHNCYQDELSVEEDVERKMGWLLKLIFVGTGTYVAYQFFPYMGDGLLQQSVSLLHVKDPLFKRMGASRLSRFAVDDERRMKVVGMGGAQALLNMLEGATDDRTRKAALKTLVTLSRSDDVAGALHKAGAIPVINSTPISLEDAEIGYYKSSLLKRFHDLRYDTALLNEVDQE